MIDQVFPQLTTDLKTALMTVKTIAEVERLRQDYLGRKGKMSAALAKFNALPSADRKAYGQAFNLARREIEQSLATRRSALRGPTQSASVPTSPIEPANHGHLHPLTQYARRVLEIWRGFGFDIHQGPELETTWFNFDGLNVPADHPARDVQDTFFIKDHDDLVLRTHTSTVQLRWPKTHHAQPPFKVVEIGKVYRHEATDATHESMFFQCDGVLVDKHVTMANLVTTLRAFINRLYPDKKFRIRPYYFPFVEPGVELDVWWERPGKDGRWLEVLGAGLVHPNVIRAMGLDPTEWQGFAFGGGLDRLAMIEYGVPDIRLFYSGDLEFLKQF